MWPSVRREGARESYVPPPARSRTAAGQTVMPEKTSISVLGPKGDIGDSYWTVEVIEQPEGNWIVTNFHGVDAEARARVYTEFLRSTIYSELVDNSEAAIRMVRDAIETLFGSSAKLPTAESGGSTAVDHAEEMVAALQRVSEELNRLRDTVASSP